jgi:hypothetical protein
MSDKRPWPRLAYTRHYEFVDEPSPAVRATRDHLLRLLSRAHTQTEREEIDLRINMLVAEENERQRIASSAALSPPAATRERGRQPWTRALFDERYAEAVDLAGDTSDVAVARRFLGLNAEGERGIEPATLARYRRRRANGDMPE